MLYIFRKTNKMACGYFLMMNYETERVNERFVALISPYFFAHAWMCALLDMMLESVMQDAALTTFQMEQKVEDLNTFATALFVLAGVFFLLSLIFYKYLLEQSEDCSLRTELQTVREKKFWFWRLWSLGVSIPSLIMAVEIMMATKKYDDGVFTYLQVVQDINETDNTFMQTFVYMMISICAVNFAFVVLPRFYAFCVNPRAEMATPMLGGAANV